MGSTRHLLTSGEIVFAILLVGTVFFGILVSAVPNENYPVTPANPPVMGNVEGDGSATDQFIGLSQAPINPEFLDYQDRINTVKRQAAAIEYSNGSSSHLFSEGVIPSPIDLSHTKGQHIRPDSGYPMVGASYPGSFDLRTLAKVSPVKDQGSAGSCWAFAAVASLESYLLPGESLDFSENNLKNTLAITYTDGFNRTWDKGGNDWMSTAYFIRWSGPVSESDDPYDPSSSYSPDGLSPARHVQNVYFLPQRASSTDNDNIKYALTTWGAVTAGINFLDPYYRSATYAFYNGGTNATVSHEITLVGWNDSYSRTNFATQPPGDGAFIAKNSWGSGWGNQGYFYISYYDLTVGKKCSVFTSEPVSNFDHEYLYDPLGWTTDLGYNSITPTTAQFANIFTAQSAETLKAVGFYTPTSNTSYIISIYLSPNSGPINSGGYATRTSGTLSSPGYHTVPIPDVTLTSGQKYSIVVSATTPGYNFPIPIEDRLNNYSSHATAHSGESYISPTGANWTDLTTISGYSNANVCIKGYTKTFSTTPGSDRIAIFRPSTGYWYFDYNLDGIVDNSFRFGGSTDQIIRGNWQGTGSDGIAIFRPSTGYWYFDYNLDGIVNNSFRFGGSTDRIIRGDWQGTGSDGIAIFRPSTGYWYFDYNLDGIVDNSFRYGSNTDQIIAGDWQGTGSDGIAIFRPSTGYWYFDYNLDGIVDNSFRYGGSTDQIIVGKWQGTLQDGIAIFRPSTGYWYFDYNLDGIVDNSFRYGGTTDQIIRGDWQGTGSDGIAIFRPSTGYWYFDYNLDGIVNNSFRYGGSTDQIIIGKWV